MAPEHTTSRARSPSSALYRVGDAILWRLGDDGRIPPWSYFEGTLQGGNLGDPSVSDLLVRAYALGGHDLGCHACDATIALRIAAGRIEALAPAPGEADIVVVGEGGRLEPRPEWNDAPMRVLRVRERALATGRGDRIEGKLAP